MNKAQKKFVEESFIGLGGIKSLTQNMMIDYLETYSKIDPTPDTKKYVVRLAGGINNDHATVNGIQYPTKESAAEHIKRFVREHMLNDSYNILSYNGELAEVRYSGYEAGVVYKRWVEEVE